MELTKLISRPERKLLILKPHMKRDARAAIELARLFPDSEAIAVLRSWAERDARAAIALARLVPDTEEKIRILRTQP